MGFLDPENSHSTWGKPGVQPPPLCESDGGLHVVINGFASKLFNVTVDRALNCQNEGLDFRFFKRISTNDGELSIHVTPVTEEMIKCLFIVRFKT